MSFRQGDLAKKGSVLGQNVPSFPNATSIAPHSGQSTRQIRRLNAQRDAGLFLDERFRPIGRRTDSQL